MIIIVEFADLTEVRSELNPTVLAVLVKSLRMVTVQAFNFCHFRFVHLMATLHILITGYLATIILDLIVADSACPELVAFTAFQLTSPLIMLAAEFRINIWVQNMLKFLPKGLLPLLWYRDITTAAILVLFFILSVIKFLSFFTRIAI